MSEAGADAGAGAASTGTGIDYSFWSNIGDEFTTRAMVLIPVAVGFNVLGGTIVRWLKIPLFMDVIGTILLAMIAGVWVAAVAGALTNILLGVTTSPAVIPAAAVQVGIALVAGWMATRGWFQIDELKDYWHIAVGGIMLTLTATFIITPIDVLLLGGFAGSGQDVAVGALLATGASLWEAVFTTQIIIDFVDKNLSIIVAYLVAMKIPKQYLPPYGQMVLGR